MTRMTSKTRVAVFYGGRSTEHSVSCVSASAIMAHLDTDRYEVIPVGITREGVFTIGEQGLKIVDGTLPEVTLRDELALSLNPQRRVLHNLNTGEVHAEIDVVFPVLHGPFGEDGTIQGMLELADIPYVGTGVLSSAASMDKEYTKKLLAAEHLPVTPEAVVGAGEVLSDGDKQRLGLPVFVKPARGGSSIGVSKVTDWEQFPAALDAARDADVAGKAIVETEIVGDEVEIGVLQYPDGSVVASVPAKLNNTQDSQEGFYGFETKYLADVVTPTIPAPYDDEQTAELQDMAQAAFRALDCVGLARVDFFVTESGPVINEINTMPGFTPISMYPQVFQASGVAYAELLDTMIQTALAD